jgi:hypothetical protein
LGGALLWGEGGGNLQTDATQLFLFVPIPAKAKKLGLLSIYKFSLVEYILLGISGLPLNSVWGTNSGRKRRGVKGMKRFSVHFNLHKPIQIVFFKNLGNCRSLFKNETLHQENSKDR